LCPATELVLERRGQQTCQPFVHLLGEDWVSMSWEPALLPRAPNMVCQPDGHGWGASRAPLAQARMRQHTVGPADHEPDLPPVARAAPGQTPGPPPQGRYEPTQGAIPAFHAGGLARLSARP
jgi:hypothetical protein